ncbi:MAG: T9SS C-terminal target domain-containing protein, partial [Bacteroidetes bacterium]
YEAGDPGIIVVGIDNGGSNRINEYTPWPNPQYGGGQGAAYVDFLVETLKPYIDANYRTLRDAEHTGIMGSSLGGLISLYAALRHPEVFGKAGVLSPSLWFSDDIYHYVDTVSRANELRIYFVAGGSESNTIDVIADVNRFVERMEASAYPALTERAFHAEGAHAEWYWAREFGSAYQWLFRDLTVLDRHPAITHLAAFPNPVADKLYVKSLPVRKWQATVYDTRGQLQAKVSWAADGLEVSQLSAGTYFMILKSEAQEWAVVRFVKQ